MTPLRYTMILLTAAVLTGLYACTSDSEEELGGVKADILFRTPAPGAMYHHGDTVAIDAQISGSAPLHGYEVWVRQVGDTTAYYQRQVHDHSQSIHVQHKWPNTFTRAADMEVIITVTLDHEGNKATQKAGFVVM